MKLKTLIQEPTYYEVLNTLEQAAKARNYVEVEPTPIVSPFWSTTFTPSSSEVFFRQIQANKIHNNPIYVIQPCIRITDLSLAQDGWHLPLFHMLSCFNFEVNSLADEFLYFLGTLSSFFEVNSTEDIFFTVSPTQEKENFGMMFLEKIGISKSNIITCNGAANYQNLSLITNDFRASTLGPRIEMFVKSSNGDFFEFGTFLALRARIDENSWVPLFGFVVGVERLSGIKTKSFDIYKLPKYESWITHVSKMLDTSMANTSLGYKAVAETISLFDSLCVVSESMHIRDSEITASRRTRNRGLNNHHRRIFNTLNSLLKELGIDFSMFLSTAQDLNDLSREQISIPSELLLNFTW
jgi:hypothetical protein